MPQLPTHFQDLDTESDDGVLCTICSEKSHLVAQRLHYWIECDRYDAWVHTYCAFGSNANSCLYVCDPHIRLFFMSLKSVYSFGSDEKGETEEEEDEEEERVQKRKKYWSTTWGPTKFKKSNHPLAIMVSLGSSSGAKWS